MKYKLLSRDLVKTGENILVVSLADIKLHRKMLMKTIDSIKNKEVFSHLCKTLRSFIKSEIDENQTSKNFLVKLVP